MTEKKIKFSVADQVKEFVAAAGKCDFDIDVLYQRAAIDGKSYLGIMSLGLPKELTVKYSGENVAFEAVMDKYVV